MTESNQATEVMRVGVAHEDAPPGSDEDTAAVYRDQDRLRGLIRRAISAGWPGSDQSDEPPLSAIIRPGDHVLIKPNWVYHRNQSGHGMDCLVTHPNFVTGVLAEVLAARPSRVTLGDAPIQGCVWEELVTPELTRTIDELSSTFQIPVNVVDFRRTVATAGDLTRGVAVDRRPAERYSLFDLAEDSWLEPISEAAPRFRVTDYDPRELSKTHHRGKHQYLLCKEVFEADVVLQLPKLKTHRKAGITGAIKNLVGLNGNKDYLPHHRAGGSAEGGDCYQGSSFKMHVAERLYDLANRNLGRRWYGPLRKLAGTHSRFCHNGPAGGLEGAWHGNDTCWRMVLDLNRILLYGNIDGTMADTRQRTVYSLTDAIIGGQGEGPLAPEPLPMGCVTFAANSVAAEWVHCHLMGLDPDRIALVKHAFDEVKWPLVISRGSGGRLTESACYLEGTRMTGRQVAQRCGVHARPAAGWIGQIEREPAL